MKNTNSGAGRDKKGINPTLQKADYVPLVPNQSFRLEAIAPCLADLRRQLELRQAMH